MQGMFMLNPEQAGEKTEPEGTGYYGNSKLMRKKTVCVKQVAVYCTPRAGASPVLSSTRHLPKKVGPFLSVSRGHQADPGVPTMGGLTV